MEANQTCPLCGTPNAGHYWKETDRDFFFCERCCLVFVPPEQFLSAQQEKAEYDLHQNSPDDQKYRHFLGRIFKPLHERLSIGSYGLDFGCGPGPTLSVMFEELGYDMEIYDVFYRRTHNVFDKTYDFITATEVLEHLHHPKQELDRLWQCLNPGGFLGIMTQLVLNRERFKDWHYKNDPTHVRFFSNATFEWLANQWQAKLTFFYKDTILLQKKNS